MSSSWISRRGSSPSSFSYWRADGSRVKDERTLERIRKLAIPPAWTDVHIAAGARASVQAWGYDARGRKQYRYHDRAVRQRELRKYYRVRQLARDLPRIRAMLDDHMRNAEHPRDRLAAGIVRLISQGFFRVGSERYVKENRTFGITTLRKRHAAVNGDHVILTYVGKLGKRQRQTVVDETLARWLRDECLTTPGTRLFRYRDEQGWHDITARAVNDYLRTRLGVPYSAKDFRTWGGTLRAATVLADLGPAESPGQATKNVNTALRLVAAELGNTPAICRASYVHPIVLARYVDEGDTIRPRASAKRDRDGVAHEPEERALIRFLDRHFPERRRRPGGDMERERRG